MPHRKAGFPDAPHGWTPDTAMQVAASEGLTLTEEHWEVVRAMQEFCSKNEFFNLRQCTDALDEAFHGKGGLKHLYKLLPGGPVAQGCRLAGIEPPSGTVDKSFGSVA